MGFETVEVTVGQPNWKVMEAVDLKVVLLGQPGVGKTCLVYRYLYNTFGETISTVSVQPRAAAKI